LSAAASVAQTGFTTKTFPAAGDSTLRVADFNRDGRADVFGFGGFSNLGPTSSGHIYLNDGNGGFKAPVALPTSSSIGTIFLAKVADVNGDGYPDIVACTFKPTTSTTVQNYLAVFLNDGSANFTLGQTILLPGGCGGLVVGDVNLDQVQDVVLKSSAQVSGATQAALITYFGDGTGKFGSPVTQTGLNFDVAPNYVGCVLTDITGGNFYLDSQFSLMLSTTCQTSSPANNGTTILGHGDGTGHFMLAASNEGSPFADSQTVDLNLDGRPDALFTSALSRQNSSAIYTATNNGSGSFTYKEVSTSSGFTGVTAADLNGDGFVDLAASGISGDPYAGPTTGAITTYLGTMTAGTYTTGQTWAVGNTSSTIGDIATADFNGDGKSDLVTVANDASNGATTLYLYTQQAASACSAPTALNSNTICSPAKGASVSSPVTVTAASNVSGFTLNRLYLDNNSVYQVASQSVNTSVTAANGTHTLVLVSYDNAGKAFSTSTTFTVGASTPSGCLPSAAGVSICAPGAGSTASSPVTITAGAIAQSGNIAAIRAYIWRARSFVPVG